MTDKTMDPEQALNLAIFAINTLQHPDASSEEDLDRLDQEADSALATLVQLRDSAQRLKGVLPSALEAVDRMAGWTEDQWENPDRRGNRD